jgi:hypothetical protein
MSIIDRDRSTGRFLEGNQAGAGRNRHEQRALYDIRLKFLSCVTDEDVRAVYEELRSMALTCPDLRVRHAAICESLDRFMGKPSVNYEVQKQTASLHLHATADTSAVIPQLSPEETAVLAKIVEKSPAHKQLPPRTDA